MQQEGRLSSGVGEQIEQNEQKLQMLRIRRVNAQQKQMENKHKNHSLDKLEDTLLCKEETKSNLVLEQNASSESKMQIIQQLRTENLLDLHNYPHPQLFHQTTYPWEALQRLPAYLNKIISSIPHNQKNKAKIIGSVYIDQNVIIGQGTVVEHGAMIKGPAYIGRNCQIRKGAYIRGNVLIGDGTTVGNSSEIKGSIIFQKCQISHFNYVGDSILDSKAHLAAGAITSNLKLDCSPVTIKIGDRILNTKMTKLGAIIGYHAQIGCNTVLNPGSIISAQTMLYAGLNFRGYLPAHHMVKLVQQQQIVTMQK